MLALPTIARHSNRTPTDDPDPYGRAKHVRFFVPGIVYHFISRTRGNLFLLRPDLEGLLRSIIAGVLAQAKLRWPHICNFATSALSNHLHQLLAARQGDPRFIVNYIAFTKREITRRWSQEVGWSGSLFDGYHYSAVITPAAQVDALRYVVAQSCKENLVNDPRQWPGFNCAETLVTGEPVEGQWLDGTAFGKARHAEKAKKNPGVVQRESFIEPRQFTFDKLPALEHLDDQAYRDQMREIVEEVVKERQQRFEKPALGPEAVCAMDPMTSQPVPMPPWFEERKRLIVWDNLGDPEVREYLEQYWDHQVSYRAASKAWLAGETKDPPPFPDLCFVPGLRPRPIAHMEQSTG